MRSTIKFFIFAIVGTAISTSSVADLNKCVDPATKKTYFTGESCPAGSIREKSAATGAYSSQTYANSRTPANPRLAQLIEQRNQAIRELEKAQLDYRLAKSTYTDQNAINAAHNRVNYAVKAAEAAHQNYLNATDPAEAAVFQQQRNARAIREQQEEAREAARQAAVRDEIRRQEDANERARMAREMDLLRMEQAAAIEAARKAEAAANNAAAAASATRGPSSCYQRMNGAIYCN